MAIVAWFVDVVGSFGFLSGPFEADQFHCGASSSLLFVSLADVPSPMPPGECLLAWPPCRGVASGSHCQAVGPHQLQMASFSIYSYCSVGSDALVSLVVSSLSGGTSARTLTCGPWLDHSHRHPKGIWLFLICY